MGPLMGVGGVHVKSHSFIFKLLCTLLLFFKNVPVDLKIAQYELTNCLEKNVISFRLHVACHFKERALSPCRI